MSTVDRDLVRHLSEVSVSVELETPEMTLNIGPQHPSTHGVLRLVAKVDGERVSGVEPVIGYMHRGYEKLAEVRSYPQITALVNRIDWVSGYANEIPFITAAEKPSSSRPNSSMATVRNSEPAGTSAARRCSSPGSRRRFARGRDMISSWTANRSAR